MDMTRRTLLGTGVAGLGLLLGACAAPSRTTTLTGGAATAARAARPLVIGAPAAPLTRDPLAAWDNASYRIIRQVLEPLLGVDPDTGSPVPQLAAEHTESDDGLEHVFRLVPDLRFEDGTACDADAVVANVRRWAAPPEPVAGTVPMPSAFVSVFGGHAGDEDTAFLGVEARGADTVVLRLSSRLRHLGAALSSSSFAISSPASWGRTLDDGGPLTPSGTGAYRWADAAQSRAVLGADADGEAPDPGTTTVLLPHEGHRDAAPDLTPVVVHAWGRADTRLRELRRGTADVIDVVAAGQLRPLVEAGTQVLPRDPFSVLYLGMNLAHPVLRSQYLRQAVAHAVDRPRIASSDVFMQGTAVAHSFVPPALGVRDEEAPEYPVNPERAQRLLEKGGYDGEPLEFLYPVRSADPALPEPERVYAMVAEDLGAVGITVTPVPVPPGEDYLRTVISRPGRALHLMGRHGHYRDPHVFLEPFTRSAQAETNYTNAPARRDVAAASAETDDERRLQLHRRVSTALLLDLPALPLVYPISALATGPRVLSYPTSPQLHEPFERIVLSDS